MGKKVKKTSDDKLLPNDIKKIGIRLKSIRKSLGFSNSDKFANHYDIDRAQYGKYETGSQDLRISSLIKILNNIGYTLPGFFNSDYDKIELQ